MTVSDRVLKEGEDFIPNCADREQSGRYDFMIKSGSFQHGSIRTEGATISVGGETLNKGSHLNGLCG